MKSFFLTITFAFMAVTTIFAQERSVKIDFESGSFVNSPKVPFNEPFLIQGELGNDIEFVKVNIYYSDKNYVLHSFTWNRIETNKSQAFNIAVPAILRSNTNHDFEIITYKAISGTQNQNF